MGDVSRPALAVHDYGVYAMKEGPLPMAKDCGCGGKDAKVPKPDPALTLETFRAE